MRVSWATACAATSVVNYGTTPSMGTKTTGYKPDAQYTMGSYTSPYIYHVHLQGLTPGTDYYYQVGDSTSGVSQVYKFTSHPGVGPEVPHVFAIVGDLGQTNNSASTVAHIQSSGRVNSVMHVGDLSYADSDEPRWDSWQNLIQPLSATTPYMVQVGNVSGAAHLLPLPLPLPLTHHTARNKCAPCSTNKRSRVPLWPTLRASGCPTPPTA